MGDNSAIEWTDATWNPTVGCSVISPGCANCYAMRMAARLERMGQERYAGLTVPGKAGPFWSGKVHLASRSTLLAPLSWGRPRKIFVNSMSDLFHGALEWGEIDTVFAVMAMAERHTFQVLTKRPEIMRAYINDRITPRRIRDAACAFLGLRHTETASDGLRGGIPWPLPNVWLGVSVEDYMRSHRLDDLAQTMAAKRFASFEPLLGSINISRWWDWLDWAIVGGESGPGARPMLPQWLVFLRDQCLSADIPFFFKQWGEHNANGARVGKRAAGAELDGREWKEMPA